MATRYRKPEPAHVQGPCVRCKARLQRQRATDHRGPLYATICKPCDSEMHPQTKARKRTAEERNSWKPLRYRRHKGDRCERCGFVPEDSCQLDVDHIDGSKANDDPTNLQTLCANCHRLKTKEDRDRRRKADI